MFNPSVFRTNLFSPPKAGRRSSQLSFLCLPIQFASSDDASPSMNKADDGDDDGDDDFFDRTILLQIHESKINTAAVEEVMKAVQSAGTFNTQDCKLSYEKVYGLALAINQTIPHYLLTIRVTATTANRHVI